MNEEDWKKAWKIKKEADDRSRRGTRGRHIKAWNYRTIVGAAGQGTRELERITVVGVMKEIYRGEFDWQNRIVFSQIERLEIDRRDDASDYPGWKRVDQKLNPDVYKNVAQAVMTRGFKYDEFRGISAKDLMLYAV